ncbi:GntR family transcriptional regulator [Brucellaceae bacterium C25G]
MQLENPDKIGLAIDVYNKLASALMSGELVPGTRLKIRDLADEMGISVTPVRDAVLRLVNNGGLSFQSPRDIRVPLLERSKYLEIRAIRLELEGLAAERAAQFATSKDIRFLEKIIEDNEQALKEGNTLQALSLNQKFHFSLPAIGQIPTLGIVLEGLWLRMGPLISSGYVHGGRVMVEKHYPVLEAIRNADGLSARNAIKDDIIAGGEVLLKKGMLS